MTECCVKECFDPVLARSLCRKHYQRLKGDYDLILNPADRVLRKIEKTSGCWLWLAAKDEYGYGRVRWDGRLQSAHRVVWEIERGEPIPADLVADHLCRNPSCVNPDHIEPVTQGVNMARGKIHDFQRSKTHCAQGHPYEGDNVRYRPLSSGTVRRECLACMRENSRRTNDRLKAERAAKKKIGV